jgi:hypothetical protein
LHLASQRGWEYVPSGAIGLLAAVLVVMPATRDI